MENIESEGNQGTSSAEIDRENSQGGNLYADLYKEPVEQNPARESIPGSEHHKCKGPEAGKGLIKEQRKRHPCGSVNRSKLGRDYRINAR